MPAPSRRAHRGRTVLLALLLLAPAWRGAAQELPDAADTLISIDEDSLPVIDRAAMPNEEAIAATIDSIVHRLRYDSSAITLRRVSPERMRRYLDDDAFQYDGQVRNPETFFGRIQRWIRDFLASLFPDDASGTFWKWVGWIAMAAALVVLVMNLNGVRGIFFRKPERNVSDFTEIEENIDAMDFTALLDEAVASRNYKRGVRLLYLRSLKDLADRELIAFRKDKTNQDYIAELRGADLHEGFRHVTTLFEYVWYGDVPVNESIFNNVRERFTDFSSNLARHREAL